MKLLTTTETAEILRISLGTLRNRLSNDDEDLPASILIGRRRLFPAETLNIWLDEKISHAIRTQIHITDKPCQRGRPKGKKKDV